MPAIDDISDITKLPGYGAAPSGEVVSTVAAALVALGVECTMHGDEPKTESEYLAPGKFELKDGAVLPRWSAVVAKMTAGKNETRAQAVRIEARRRIALIMDYPTWEEAFALMADLNRRATFLISKSITGQPLTAAERAEAAEITKTNMKVDAVWAAHAALPEPAPDDFADDKYWPPKP